MFTQKNLAKLLLIVCCFYGQSYGQSFPENRPKLWNEALTTEFNAGNPNAWNEQRAQKLVQAIERAEEDALPPQRYHLDQLRPFVGDERQQLLYTDAFLTLANDLANGLVEPTKSIRHWNAEKMDGTALQALLAQALSTEDFAKALDSLNANNPRYRGLKLYYNQLRRAKRENQGIDLAQLAINMERQRWLPQNLPGSYILVNIPDYSVSVFENNINIFKTNAVIGSPRNKTPSFVDEMQHIVMSPNWYPPNSLKRTGSSFVRAGARGNPMGKVKFLFPNHHSIYLHDTPNKHLFGRAVSHGCIRVNNAEQLANVLLRHDGQWNEGIDLSQWQQSDWKENRSKKISQAMHRRRESWVSPEPVPIYLVYWTVWAEPVLGSDRRITYAIREIKRDRHGNDIYQKDRGLLALYWAEWQPYSGADYQPPVYKTIGRGRKKRQVLVINKGNQATENLNAVLARPPSAGNGQLAGSVPGL